MPLDHENVKVGDRVSYEDMANPTRYGAVLEVIERGGKTPSGFDLPSGREYRVGWDSDYGWLGPETVSDLRQHGWKRVAGENEVVCPDCKLGVIARGDRCTACSLSWEALEDAAAFLDALS